MGKLGLVLALWAGHAGLAQADVWGYIDEKGVAHFAPERLDERYEIFFRSGQVLATRDTVAPAQPAPLGLGQAGAPENGAAAADTGNAQTNSSAPKNAARLALYFDVSPSFKSVKHHLREASANHKIDLELLQAVIATESGFDALAVSPKGAVGLMQLMPATAQRFGVKQDANTPIEKKLTDPQTNIRAGSRYLRYLINLFPGKLELAVAAYNAGEGAVQRYGNAVPPYKETQNYVKTVMQMYAYLKPPAPAPLPVAKLTQSQPQPLQPLSQQANHGRPINPVATPIVGGAIGRANMVSNGLVPVLPAVPKTEN